jgi:hypothetical protein
MISGSPARAFKLRPLVQLLWSKDWLTAGGRQADPTAWLLPMSMRMALDFDYEYESFGVIHMGTVVPSPYGEIVSYLGFNAPVSRHRQDPGCAIHSTTSSF